MNRRKSVHAEGILGTNVEKTFRGGTRIELELAVQDMRRRQEKMYIAKVLNDTAGGNSNAFTFPGDVRLEMYNLWTVGDEYLKKIKAGLFFSNFQS